MKKRRVLAGILSFAMALTVAATPVMATTFDDVDNDATVSWAKESIEKMVNAGYIKGYEDGTFKPYRAISKIECLILMARMLGAEEAAYAAVKENAEESYGEVAGKHNNTYTKELAYLLYNGIITEEDLAAYASESTANTELTRAQAAILMAKLLGANSEAAAFQVSAATYPDDEQIPTGAKPYVEYVTEQNIMNGMASTDGSATVFSPNTSLTRAQMATLLARMIAKINKSTYSGTVDALDAANKTITFNRNGNESKRSLNEDTVCYLEGERVNLEDLKEGYEVGALEINGHVQTLYVTNATMDESESVSVYAVITMIGGGSEKKITLADSEDANNTATYTLAKDCVITIDGAKATVNDLKKKDFVKATINNGKMVAIEVTDPDFVVNGTLVGIEFDDDNHVYVIVADQDGNEQEYVVANKGATVVRDQKAAEYRDLSSGDEVKVTISNGKVTRVTAISATEEFSGMISEIHITANPYLVVVIDGKEKEYKLRSDASIKIAGADATVYDLRRNTKVNGTLDGVEIKKLTAEAVATTLQGELSGSVVGVNTSYKVINVEDANGNIHSVYYNTKTTFLNSNGSSTVAKDVERGDAVTITGAEKNGVFEATIVIVK